MAGSLFLGLSNRICSSHVKRDQVGILPSKLKTLTFLVVNKRQVIFGLTSVEYFRC